MGPADEQSPGLPALQRKEADLISAGTQVAASLPPAQPTLQMLLAACKDGAELDVSLALVRAWLLLCCPVFNENSTSVCGCIHAGCLGIVPASLAAAPAGLHSKPVQSTALAMQAQARSHLPH